MRLRSTSLLPFFLLLATTAGAQPPSAPTVTPLRVGQTVDAELGEGDYLYPNGAYREDYEVIATPGGQIDVVFASQSLFPDLAVGIRDDGGCHAECKRGSNLDAAVRRYTVPASGKVRIRLASSFPGSKGAYRLTVLAGGAAAPEPAKQKETLVALGQTMAGELTASDPVMADGRAYDVFLLSHKPGESIQVTARSTTFDALMVAGPLVAGGKCISLSGGCLVDDDSAGGRNPRITTKVPASGYLWISVTGPNATRSRGAYSLEVVPAPTANSVTTTSSPAPVATPKPTSAATANIAPAPASRPRRPPPQSIALGKPVSGTLSPDDGQRADGKRVDFFEFRAPAGTRVRVTMTSSSFAPVILVGTDGSLNCMNACQSAESGADGRATLGGVVVTGMELLRIVVSGQAADAMGPYTLTVTADP